MLCIEMVNCTVSNVTLSSKSSMAAPGRTRASRGRRTLSTRLSMVSKCKASDSLVRTWANPCRVRGRLSLSMMARPIHPKHAQYDPYLGNKRVMVTAPSHLPSRNYFTAAVICGQTLSSCSRMLFPSAVPLVWKAV